MVDDEEDCLMTFDEQFAALMNAGLVDAVPGCEQELRLELEHSEPMGWLVCSRLKVVLSSRQLVCGARK